MTLLRAIQLKEIYAPYNDNLSGALDLAIRLNEYHNLKEDETSILDYLASKCDQVSPGKFRIKEKFLDTKQVPTREKDADGKIIMRTVQTLKVPQS